MVDNSPESVHRRLCEGNTRFIEGKQLTRYHITRRQELASHQQPYVGIVTCSDSRVSPEHLFDAGLGELFFIRNAGNVVDVNALASLEYAVEHLGVGFVVVLGHEMCGAVYAACSGDDHVGNLGLLMADLGEAVRRGGCVPGRVVVENVLFSLERLRVGSERLRGLVDGGSLTVTGALYSLESGVVRWL